MSNRDEFTKTTKDAVATRAGWRCSFQPCGKATAGPSAESPEKTTIIGEAAHISGASPGPGSRRYLESMTREERRSINNAIWLCSDHAKLIDRDQVTYTIEVLQAMKRAHEASQARDVATRANPDLGAGLLAIGPDIVCMGDIENVSEAGWTLRLKHFVIGEVHDLVAYIGAFATKSADNRYVLSNELGDGRVLAGAPELTKQPNGFTLLCPIEPSYPRIDVQNLGSMTAMHPDTNDMYIENGNIARVSGLAAFPQAVRSALSMQRSENVFHPNAGMRFFEYFEEFKGTPWLGWLLTLDVVRQASIPYTDTLLQRQSTPLPSVTRVRSFELISETPTDHRLPVRANFEVKGLGPWRHEFMIYMPTRSQMSERAELNAQRRF